MFGARYGELCQDPLPDVKSGTTIVVRESSITTSSTIGKVVAVNLRCGVANYCNYHVDQDDSPTVVAGFIKRVAVNVKGGDRCFQDEFFKFVRIWVESNLKPLPPDTDFDFELWLAESRYPESRKKQLRAVRDEYVLSSWKERTLCKSFIKDEFYDGIKYARTINARADWFKTFSGPLFKAIEHVIFQMPCFVKYIPVSERTRYVAETLVGGGFVSTSDFKSFEGSFSPKIIRNCEGFMYRYMLRNCPLQQSQMETIIRVLCGRNQLCFKRVRGTVKGVRMSGEMCTSLGNGFTNMMLMLFYCFKTNNQCVSCFEGDDGIHLSKRPFEDPVGFFSKLGFNLDFSRAASLGDAKFCGVSFDDQFNAQINCRKVLLNTTWMKSCYASAGYGKLMSLLRARALSLLYRVPNCPVVSAYGHWLERCTKNFRPQVGLVTNYEREILLQSFSSKFLAPLISAEARETYARVYGVSVETQLELESMFNSTHSLQLLSHPAFDQLFTHENMVLWNHYVSESGWMVRFINDQNNESEAESWCSQTASCTIEKHATHYYTRICSQSKICEKRQ